MTLDSFISASALCLFLVRTAVVSSVILVVAWLSVSRCGSAAIRHGLWLAAVIGCCLAPLSVALLPAPGLGVSPGMPEPAISSPSVSAAESVANAKPAPQQELLRSEPSPAVANSPEFIPSRSLDSFAPAYRPVNSYETLSAAETSASKEPVNAAAPEEWLAIGWHRFTERFGRAIVGTWIVVMLGLVIRHSLALSAARRLCRNSTRFDSEAAQAALAALCGELGITGPIDLRLGQAIDVPMVAGIGRPCLLLPENAHEWPPSRMRAVLRHELGHVARHDLLSQFVADLAACVWWFQPLLWYAAHRLRIEREFACDDLVLRSGAAACDYADELLVIAAHAAGHQPSSPVLVAMACRTTVEQRIRAVLNPALNRIPWNRRGTAVAAFAVLLLLAVIAPLTPTILVAGRGAEPQGDEEDQQAVAVSDTKSSIDNGAGKEARAEQKAEAKDASSKQDSEHDRLSGRVVDQNEQPVAGVEVTLETYGDQPEPATTDAEGRFELNIAQSNWKYSTLAARPKDRKLIGIVRLPREERELRELDLKITLGPVREIPVRVVDGAGQPVTEAMVGVLAGYRDAGATATDSQGTAVLHIPAGDDVQQVYAVKPGVGLDYRSFELAREVLSDRQAKKPEFPKEGVTLTLDGVRPLRVTLLTSDAQPIQGAKAYVWLLKKPGETSELNLSYLTRRPPFLRQANERGRVTFDWIPLWQEQQLTIWPQVKEFTRERGMYDPISGTGEFTLRLNRLVPIRGKVMMPNGKPASGLLIDIVGVGYDHNDFRQTTKSRDDGTFEVLAAPNKVYLLVVKDAQWAAEPATGFALWPDKPVQDLEFRLRPTTRVHGRVTLGADDEPVAGLQIISYQYGADAHNLKGVALPNPERENRWVQPMLAYQAMTDADGRYEFFVGPGNFDIRGPNQNKIEKFEIRYQTEKVFDFHMDRPEKGILKGLVVAGDPPQPVAGAKVHGIERWHFGGDLSAVTDEHGRFEVERNLHPTAIHVQDAEGSLGGLTEVDADASEMTITLQPTAAATGLLFDDATNAPIADQEIVFGINVPLGDKNAPYRSAFGGTIRTDAEGKFRLERLVQGGNYRVSRTIMDGRSWNQVATVTPDKSGDIDLGTIVVKPQREYKPPTLAGRIAQAFTHERTPVERFAAVLPDAKLARLRILMLLADPEGNFTTQFMKLRFEDKDVRSAFDDFRLIAVNSAPPDLDQAKLLAEKLDRDLQGGRSTFFVIVADEEGKLVGTAEGGDLAHGGEINQEKMLRFLKRYALEPLDAKVLYDEALAQAKRENKRVIFQETATWCGPCWTLSRFLDEHRSVWEQDYLWVKMDHRWTGAQELMKELRGQAEAGVPWWVIVDAEGKKLTTSNMPSGENIGFPSSAEGIQHFQSMLEQTAQRLTPEQIQSLVQELQSRK